MTLADRFCKSAHGLVKSAHSRAQGRTPVFAGYAGNEGAANEDFPALGPRLRGDERKTSSISSKSALAGMALALVAVAISAMPAAAQFKATSVTLYIPSGIGGGYDTYGRLASRHLGRFLPGNPAIVPKNMPGAGGVVLANYL